MARTGRIANREIAPVRGNATGPAVSARSDQDSSRDHGHASHTRQSADGASDPLGLDALSASRRMELELAARRAGDSDEALERVIAILLPGNAERHEAVVRAFRQNDKLRTQWAKAYETLTS
jgi:hypothetical protein